MGIREEAVFQSVGTDVPVSLSRGKRYKQLGLFGFVDESPWHTFIICNISSLTDVCGQSSLFYSLMRI